VKIIDYLADDFNKKNSRPYKLENKFKKERHFADEKYTGFTGRARETVKISRPGFNKEENQALIFIIYQSNSSQEAFYEESNFVFLEKKEDRWIVMKKVMASQRYY
jgi:U3 small nucleolar RNA-associated protein 14